MLFASCKGLLITLLVGMMTQQVIATTYHVSLNGSSTPPYDTYATAANHPREALAGASGLGDTVLIHAGQYDIDTAISVPDGVYLIGTDRDSVNLTWCCWQDYSPRLMFNLEGSHTVTGITFDNFTKAASQDVVAIFMAVVPGDVFVSHCTFRQVYLFGSVWDTLEVHDCVFETGSRFGVHTTTGFGTVLIHDNYFTGGASAFSPTCVQVWGETATIEDNIFDLSESNFRGTSVDAQEGSRPLIVRNNLMIGGDRAISWSLHDGVIENNTIIQTDPSQSGCILAILGAADTLAIRNNIIIDSPVPRFFNCNTCPPNTPLEFSFNSFWPPVTNFYSLVGSGAGLNIIDTANVNRFPMFSDDSSYHLQAGSPLIDAGDPSILDADGSRSDIGWTGGPNGIIASYPELPPLAPDSLTANSNGSVVALSWPPRFEADLDHYRIYRGDMSGFWTPGLTPIRTIPHSDTTAADTLLSTTESYFYVVTAVDTTGLESDPSPEVEHLVTGVSDLDDDAVAPRQFGIVRTYPNPFNANLMIEYSMPETAVGRPVMLEVYNVLGQRVASLDAGSSSPGFHQFEWSLDTRDGHSLSSGVYAVRLRVGGVVVGRTVKVVLLK